MNFGGVCLEVEVVLWAELVMVVVVVVVDIACPDVSFVVNSREMQMNR